MEQSLREKAVFASRYFPHLYKCIHIPDPSIKHTKLSQSHEDTWLDHNIFSKLPENELYGGTFLEMGALDGLLYSNSYYFEKKYDWRGLLIEGHPLNQLLLRTNEKKRLNSALFPTAICNYKSDGSVDTLTFTADGGAVGTTLNATNELFLNIWHKNHKTQTNIDEPCVPLQPIFETTGMFDIDLFSLDVEGAEYLVLQTIDFNVTNIRVIVVENDGNDKIKDQAVRDLLLKVGFFNAMDTLGNIRSACDDINTGCTSNEVFLNPYFIERKNARIKEFNFPRYFEYGTGVPCEKALRQYNETNVMPWTVKKHQKAQIHI